MSTTSIEPSPSPPSPTQSPASSQSSSSYTPSSKKLQLQSHINSHSTGTALQQVHQFPTGLAAVVAPYNRPQQTAAAQTAQQIAGVQQQQIVPQQPFCVVPASNNQVVNMSTMTAVSPITNAAAAAAVMSASSYYAYGQHPAAGIYQAQFQAQNMTPTHSQTAAVAQQATTNNSQQSSPASVLQHNNLIMATGGQNVNQNITGHNGVVAQPPPTAAVTPVVSSPANSSTYQHQNQPITATVVSMNNGTSIKYGTLIPNRVFVGGISATTTEADLHKLFSTFGNVKATKIISDRGGCSKGYGFVTFETEEEAKKLQAEADNIILKERKLNIAPAIKKQQSYPRSYEVGQQQQPLMNDGVVYYHNGIPYTYQNGVALFQDATAAATVSGIAMPAESAGNAQAMHQALIPNVSTSNSTSSSASQLYIPGQQNSSAANFAALAATTAAYQQQLQQQQQIQAYQQQIQQQVQSQQISTQVGLDQSSAVTKGLATTAHTNQRLPYNVF